MHRITVVGIGADGWDGLAMSSRKIVREAEVVMGGKRLLDTLPWAWWQERVEWPASLEDALATLLAEHEDKKVAVMASGDPLVAGIGGLLVDAVGAESVEILPGLSSETLARARMRWSYEQTSLVSLEDHEVRRLVQHLAPGRRLIVLSGDGGTPSSVASLLRERGYGGSTMTVLGDLGAITESRTEARADAWADRVSPELNVICLECVADPDRRSATSRVPGLPDDAHATGALARDLRTAALARLGPAAGDLLVDVGSGAGCVAVEWVRAEPLARAVTLVRGAGEVREARAVGTELGVPALELQEATDEDAVIAALVALDAPDAVFVGPRYLSAAVLDAARGSLKPGSRLVAQAVTPADQAMLTGQFLELGGELVRLQADVAQEAAWQVAEPTVQWSLLL
ncbi:precorrin-6Y C5,15-methyltransferase (decarboxylating) [Mumia flava]|uniref:Precorrin-6Y C5,15-methyltransferase (Decarboxylating) n=1 Tax=Mumia flava TaxID=1348852 RepID=A0A0B2BVC8_9ACTN|nr:precorrin-6y C5,15-methyltransferase (decarboxylating) subunit CbiE [Mumia flava]PJJ58061.1 precorrin-6Y C5,15-methyltransferase (decarboxylating) [Mumia flava]